MLRRGSQAARRAGALLALAIALVIVLVVLPGGSPYVIHAQFQDASQLIPGDHVEVAGRRAGTIEAIELDDDGTARITLEIDQEFAPLRSGARVQVRLRSLLGQANRYLDLQPGPATEGKLASGATLDTAHTRSSVDFDTVLDLLDPKVRASIRRYVAASARQFEDRGVDANEGLMYLAPALSTTDQVAAELGRDRPRLRRFVVRGAGLMRDVASRASRLRGLITHLAGTGFALASRQAALSAGIARLPAFLDQGRGTLARLSSTLTVLRPLVEESKPLAARLGPFLAELRGFATDARPTVRDLSRIVTRPGAGNDLRDLLASAPPVRDIATLPVHANGKRRPGSFPVTASALRQVEPMLAFLRPYSPELTGWFNDFGATGVYDALGGTSRSSAQPGAFQNIDGVVFPIPPELRGEAFQQIAQIGFTERCPGAVERDPGDHSTPFAPPGFHCDPEQVPEGP